MTDEQRGEAKKEYSVVLKGKNELARGNSADNATEEFAKRAVGKSAE